MEAPFRENVYGHLQRLQWLRAYLKPEDRVVEFGCGTGRLITVPLRSWGYDVTGVDLDEVVRLATHATSISRDRRLSPRRM